ncbi:chromosome partitioning protein [Malonomonas rubra DSM 5091]|uniref:Chromosome partitioning protein n=1 Tax=Malonomonas rubra DSM 5091 TaxID=1122189 RepID=A0A1M6GHR0_MALRU|nr:AAA family ATPase [Malonomonas rubra]SHJ09412.1 chromosome partitioning protein [Malonomonas rubra DSM 5091]
MKVLACYSIKGGVGKTASAVNLAYWAAKSGYRTLLLDLDSQGASSFYFRVKSPVKKNWGKRLLKAYGEVLKQVKESDYKNLDVVPAHLSFRNFDILLDEIGKRKNRLSQALKGLKKEYDLIILDCPPTISRLAENIFNASDIVLVPVIPTTLSERTFEQLLKFFKQQDYSRKKLLPFFTMADGRKQLHRETATAMRKRYKYFLKHAIPYSTDVEKMGKYRAPIDIFARGRLANKSYFALWKEIESKLEG